jgi:hypothetical protein
MADLVHTHRIDFHGDVVTKQYVDDKPGAAAREWRALTLLAEYAPGLAPEPIAFEGDLVRMSRIDGVPLRGLPARDVRIGAMAHALTELYESVPPHVVASLRIRPWHLDAVTDWVRQRFATWTHQDPRAEQAVKEGRRWLESWRPGEIGLRPVFGAGDGNLANFLWDGARVRIVDFEDSGRSDLAFELAELSEHVSMWVDGEVEIAHRFELSRQEESRLRGCRKLQCLIWLFLLSRDSSRNPPGTFLRQAERVLRTLDA